MVKSKRWRTEEKCPNNAYESLRMARIAENQVRLAQLGVQKRAEDLEALLKHCQTEEKCPNNAYESIGMARTAENQVRLEQLGVQKQAGDLKAFFKVKKSPHKFKNRSSQKSVFENKTPIRRSERLKNRTSSTTNTEYKTPIRRSERLKNRTSSTTNTEYKTLRSPSSHTKIEGLFQSDNEKNHPKGTRNLAHYRFEENGEIRPANAPLPKCSQADLLLSPDLLPQRCNSKSRGSVYDPIVGICCHSCRQKKLCGEEDCERCGNRDVTKVCLGKTDCSSCHSSTGVFCRGCLKVRYGEDIEEVRENKDWMCPHCSEEKGTNPYWICNSSFCLKKRNIRPTGVAIYRAREMGYESVAHYLADVLRKQGFSRK